MAKKKRQLRLLLLLLAVAVALFVAAFCWNRWQTAQEEAEAEAAVRRELGQCRGNGFSCEQRYGGYLRGHPHIFDGRAGDLCEG